MVSITSPSVHAAAFWLLKGWSLSMRKQEQRPSRCTGSSVLLQTAEAEILDVHRYTKSGVTREACFVLFWRSKRQKVWRLQRNQC